jgi:CRISPR/Cas system CSM-associated protein Csm3 (group 7 of RAMP superfamily)
MSQEAEDGLWANAFPLTCRDRVGGATVYRLLLPGSSIKGSLRGRAEFIARVARGIAELPSGQRLVDQLATAATLPAVAALFGKAGDGERDAGLQGALTVHDVRTHVTLDGTLWESVRHAPKQDDDPDRQRAFAEKVDHLNTALSQADPAAPTLWFDYAIRNSIDRWTGGVADAKLFAAIEPYATAGVWEDIVLDLDLGRLQSNAPDLLDRHAALALFLLVLRDLADGWIPLGFGATRGLGAIELLSGYADIERQVTAQAEVSLEDLQAAWTEAANNTRPERVDS